MFLRSFSTQLEVLAKNNERTCISRKLSREMLTSYNKFMTQAVTNAFSPKLGQLIKIASNKTIM